MSILKGEVVKLLFDFFEERKITYCVIGDTRSLPETISSDIDIVVRNDDYRDIAETLKDFTSNLGYSLIQIMKHEITASFFIVSICKNNKIRFIHPDICSDYYFNAKRLIKSNEILSRREIAKYSNGDKKGFFKAAPDIEFIYYLVKKIAKLSICQKQFEYLCDQYLVDPPACRTHIEKYWKKENVDLIVKAINSRDIKLLNDSLNLLHKELFSRLPVTISERWLEFKRKVQRVRNPTGLSIVLLGPDGAGKTAVGDRLMEELSPAFRGLKRFHLRPSFISYRREGGAPVTDPHGKPPRSMTASIAKLFYFFSDYTVGYLLTVWPYKIRSHLIVFDRYYHDMLIDPLRYRYGAPKFIAKVVGFFIPTPDLFIILDAPADVIHERKKEVSLEETKRQRAAYLDFAKKRTNCIVLDSSLNIDTTVHIGCETILNYMEDRLDRTNFR